MEEEDLKVLGAMEKYGGSFVKALALLAYRADSTNLHKIKATWPEYWQQYRFMGGKP